MGKGGGSKGKNGSRKGGLRPWEVVKTVVKYVEVPRGKGKSKFSTKGSRKGSGKGKGKGKGKRRAAPLNSKHWERKLENENREILGDKTYAGTVSRYILKHGYGFILPDNPKALPKTVKAKLQESAKTVAASGKEVENPDLLYFRKPDVNHEEGFKLADGTPCTFQIYIDDKGAGACEVSPA